MATTEENLKAAFAGESQARNKYTYFAQVARKEGYHYIAKIFEETADNEMRHAKDELKLLGGIGDTAANLRAAVGGEDHETMSMYPDFAAQAKADGNAEAARLFTQIAKIEAHHRDLAFNVQWRLEQVVRGLVRTLIGLTGVRSLCLAGGVAMNCCMNGTLSRMDEVREIFVQPAAADNGIALGAAYLMARQAGVSAFERFRHAYWGPAFSDAQVEAAIRESKLPSRRSADLVEEVARRLAEGQIVGWLQGRMEVGARALGNRSILASPLVADMKAKLNREVKHREDWRPFCPSLPIDDYRTYFEHGVDSDYMILAYPVRPEFGARIPSVVHVDGTARPQTVRPEHNPKFYALLKAFGRLTGHPVLINTSFNVQGEPIVCTPADALRCFGGTGLDVLVLNEFILTKP